MTTKKIDPNQFQLGDGQYLTRDELFDNFRDVGGAKDWLYDWNGLNKWLFTQINGIRGDYYDNAMVLISKWTDHEQFPYYMLGLLCFVVFSTLYRKFIGKGAVRPRLVMWFGIFIVLIVGYAANGLATRELKQHFAMPRPYVELAPADVHVLEIKDRDDSYRSFPSGHIAFITFFIISLWPAFRDDWKWYTLGIIAVVAWSRVSLGVHYPADTVWAFIFTGTLIVCVRFVIYFLLRKIFNIIC